MGKFSSKPEPPKPAIKLDFSAMPKLREGSTGEAVLALKHRLFDLGFYKGSFTPDFYEYTTECVKAFQKARGLTPDGVVATVTWGELEKDGVKVEEKAPAETPPASPSEGKPAWKVEAEKHKGQVETNATFSGWIRGKIKIFLGYLPPTIATSTYAWCGYFIVTVLGVSGYQYHKQGEMARNWGGFGNQIVWQSQGIPEAAIVWINHGHDCKASSLNHVALANGSCTVQDFFDKNGKLKPGASIDLLGGNQNNQVNVTTFSAAEICGVRYPDKTADGKPVPLPRLPVTQSINCTSGKVGSVSTR